jgi:hypothetical protein
MTTGQDGRGDDDPDRPPGSTPPDADARYRWGIVVIGIGVGALVLAFLIVALFWQGPDGASALGIVASPIAAMVGAYFGIQASASSARSAQDEAKSARDQAAHATAAKSDAVADAKVVLSELAKNDPAAADDLRGQLSTFD